MHTEQVMIFTARKLQLLNSRARKLTSSYFEKKCNVTLRYRLTERQLTLCL